VVNPLAAGYNPPVEETMTIHQPKTDVIFKLLMGNPRHLNLLQGFLSSLLPLPKEEYQGLVLVDPQVRGDFPESKPGVLDVRVNTASGKNIDVEIQLASVPGMRERIQFYNTSLASQSA
jgi:predicted transposase/invertase (TIGR01784 family)